jgi:hypothetical protein
MKFILKVEVDIHSCIPFCKSKVHHVILLQDGFNTHEDQRPQSERSQENDDPWDF